MNLVSLAMIRFRYKSIIIRYLCHIPAATHKILRYIINCSASIDTALLNQRSITFK